MAAPRPHLRWAPWHLSECSVCGCPINDREITSYQAIPAHSDISGHAVPSHFHGSFCLRIGSTRSFSSCRETGTRPALYLVDNACYDILVPKSLDAESVGPEPLQLESLRQVILVARPTRPTDPKNNHLLSASDSAALVAAFDPAAPRSKFQHYRLPVKLQNDLLQLPVELRDKILSYCDLNGVLELARKLEAPYFGHVVKNDPVRKRVAMSIQANRLLRNDERQPLPRERIVTLSAKMKAIFIDIGGQKYLQEIVEESSCPTAVDVVIEDGRPQLLALHVDDWGVRNIAFSLDEKGRPKWLRDDTRIHRIFMDRGDFKRIRIVSDPLKCRMVDADLPDRNSFHPRALLPSGLGTWRPWAVNMAKWRYLELEGYAEPSYINFASCPAVYLSYSPSGGLRGIFTEPAEGHQEVSLGAGSKRAVKLYGLDKLGNHGFALLQIQANNGKYLPDIDISDCEELGIESYQEVEGIWWVETEGKFLFNVVYSFES